MSEIGGFDWWFRNRDYVLRDSVENLYAESAAAHRRASRISSQLSRLQGSIEGRLNALTAAFDAYVELGDVREQLTGYAEPAIVRREAMDAIAALGEGGTPTAVDDRDTGYWIAAATNAVIARNSGAVEPGEADLIAGEPEAALFIVAAMAAVGRGPEMSEQAAGLLRPAGELLDEDQLVLWRAARAGIFGPDVWQQVVTGWAPELTVGAGETDAAVLDPWWSWASAQASAAGTDVLDWLETQPGEPGPAGAATPAEADEQAQVGELKEIVIELISAGQGEEGRLLARARELRAKIESAGQPAAPTRNRRTWTEREDPPDRDQQASGRTVAEVVRQAYEQTAPGSADRTLLFGLIAPALSAVLEQRASSYLTTTPAVVKVSLPGGPVEVSPSGPDSADQAEHASARQRMRPTGSRPIMIAGGVAGAAVIIALIGLIAGAPVLSAVVFAIAVIAGLGALKNWLTQRRDLQAWEDRCRQWDAQLTEGADRARRIQEQQRELRQQRADQLDRIRQVLRKAN